MITILMSVAVALLAVVAGFFAVYIVRANDQLLANVEARLKRAEDELRDANGRLFAAWSDGKVIPPSELPYVDPVAETPLTPELREFLAQYDDATVRAKYDRMIRAGLAKQMSPLAILKTFETPGV